MKKIKSLILILLFGTLFLSVGCSGFQIFPEKQYCSPGLAADSYILKWVDPGLTDLSLMAGTAYYLKRRPEKASEIIKVADAILKEIENVTITYDSFQKILMEKLGPLMYVAATPLLEHFKGIKVPISECDRILIKGEARKQKNLAEMIK